MKLIIAAAALAAATAAGAQQPRPVAVAPNATLDPEALAAARELILASGVDAQVEEMAQRSAKMAFETQLASIERRAGRAVPPELRAAMEEALRAHVGKFMPDLKTALLEDGAKTYARYFTAAEIRELQRLQSNPVMVKFRSVAPAFMMELMQIGVTAASRHDAELETSIAAVVSKWEAEHKAAAPARRS
jgi:hypothetical protein